MSKGDWLLQSPRGARERLTYKEVCQALHMTYGQVRHLVQHGDLHKRASGRFPFHIEDLNRFIQDFNNCKVGNAHSSKGV